MAIGFVFNVFSGTFDAIDQGGSFWLSPVANLATLQAITTDADGSIRVVLSTNDAYRWNLGSVAWQYVGQVKTSAVGSSPNANGFSVGTDNTITLQPADATHPGVVTTGAQTLAGTKTFSTAPILSSLSISQAVFTDSSKNVVSNAITGTGNVVMSASPTLTGVPLFSGSGSGTTGLQASAAASGTLTLPAATDTLVGKATTDTFTNKSISGNTNTLSNIANGSLTNSSITIGSTSVSLGGTAATIAGLTLTLPTIASFTPDSGTHTLTVPAVTDTLAAIAATQVLTNKTIAASSNTISGLTNSNLSGSAGITSANIAANTVANSNLAQMAANSIKGNNTGSTANAADLTVAQVKTMLGYSGGDIAETSFSAANNQSAAADVTGLTFANATVRGFDALVSVFVNASSSLYETFSLRGIQRGSDWQMSTTSVGDVSGFTFSITTAGQVQYVNSSYAGFTAATVKFRAITVSV